MTTSCLNMGAARLAELIASGRASAVDVMEQHIARLQQVNPQLNAMVWDFFEAARVAAREADAQQACGEPLGPLHGVPFTVKEYLDVPGSPSTHGLESLKHHRASTEDVYVARLRAAGGIPLCKSNVPQLLLYYESDNPVYGRANHPQDPARSPGGSSGGEAALIAAGASPIGLGSDIGGSLRVPAHFCGICSIKPTMGRCNDNSRVMPQGQRSIVAQVGPMAPHVADVALGLAVLNGAAGDFEPSRPLGDYRAVDVSQLRVAFYTDDGTFTPMPAVARAVHEAAGMLRAAGATVTAWQPPDVPQALDTFYGLLGGDAMGTMKRRFGPGRKAPQIAQLMLLSRLPGWLVKSLGAVLSKLGQSAMAASMKAFGDYSALHFWDLTEAQRDYQQCFAQAMATAPGGPFDIILCPPCALPAFTHGASTDLLTAGAYAALYNLLGYPAGVVPVTRVRADETPGLPESGDRIRQLARQVATGSAGLPLGVQVVARPWCEHEALAVMQVIETAVLKTTDFRPA
ncbi:MAG: hypothetical protein RLZZ401_791 [Pseudomonadota bacterium]